MLLAPPHAALSSSLRLLLAHDHDADALSSLLAADDSKTHARGGKIELTVRAAAEAYASLRRETGRGRRWNEDYQCKILSLFLDAVDSFGDEYADVVCVTERELATTDPTLPLSKLKLRVAKYALGFNEFVRFMRDTLPPPPLGHGRHSPFNLLQSLYEYQEHCGAATRAVCERILRDGIHLVSQAVTHWRERGELFPNSHTYFFIREEKDVRPRAMRAGWGVQRRFPRYAFVSEMVPCFHISLSEAEVIFLNGRGERSVDVNDAHDDDFLEATRSAVFERTDLHQALFDTDLVVINEEEDGTHERGERENWLGLLDELSHGDPSLLLDPCSRASRGAELKCLMTEFSNVFLGRARCVSTSHPTIVFDEPGGGCVFLTAPLEGFKRELKVRLRWRLPALITTGFSLIFLENLGEFSHEVEPGSGRRLVLTWKPIFASARRGGGGRASHPSCGVTLCVDEEPAVGPEVFTYDEGGDNDDSFEFVVRVAGNDVGVRTADERREARFRLSFSPLPSLNWVALAATGACRLEKLRLLKKDDGPTLLVRPPFALLPGDIGDDDDDDAEEEYESLGVRTASSSLSSRGAIERAEALNGADAWCEMSRITGPLFRLSRALRSLEARIVLMELKKGRKRGGETVLFLTSLREVASFLREVVRHLYDDVLAAWVNADGREEDHPEGEKGWRRRRREIRRILDLFGGKVYLDLFQLEAFGGRVRRGLLTARSGGEEALSVGELEKGMEEFRRVRRGVVERASTFLRAGGDLFQTSAALNFTVACEMLVCRLDAFNGNDIQRT